MKILAIETSCDETAIAIVETKKGGNKLNFKILANEISSQISLHAQYGGVFPMMAKREHGKNIVYLLENALRESKLYELSGTSFSENKKKLPISLNKREQIKKILERENDLYEKFQDKLFEIKKPKINAIAVTVGPGLEPTLWVGINLAKALSTLWNIPIIPVNHMEGHIYSIFPNKTDIFSIDLTIKIFPVLSLLVSGGHTELVLIKNFHHYEKIGQTRDDSVGEAFDKVARMLGLPYPGGPEIGKLAEIERSIERRCFLSESLAQADGPSRAKNQQDFMCAYGKNKSSEIKLPRPMINSKDYDFSFSGLKTAVLYLIRDLGSLNDEIKRKIAKEFENACIDVLVTKTIKALKQYKIQTLIVGGGVSANTYLQKIMLEKITENKLEISTFFPKKEMTGDNALMIAISGYLQYKNKKYTKNIDIIKANGNLSL